MSEEFRVITTKPKGADQSSTLHHGGIGAMRIHTRPRRSLA